MKAEPIEINGIKIEPGSSEALKMYIGKLPSGNRIYIRGTITHALEKGPVVLITGGVHGDEINSVQIVRQFIEAGDLNQLQRGTVISIPVVNTYGFIYFSRDLPDGKDVNRSFPGNRNGSLASRIASVITKVILPVIDYGLDFHTGGASRYNYPQIRYSKSDQKSAEIARVFGAPHILSRGTIPKSFRREALKARIPFLVFEGGESLRLDGHSIEVAAAGIKRLLHHLDMIKSAPQRDHRCIHILKTSWIRASQAGLFTWKKRSGDFVKPKDNLGVVQDPLGELNINILATKSGHIVGHNNAAVVSQGEALYHLGYEYESW